MSDDTEITPAPVAESPTDDSEQPSVEDTAPAVDEQATKAQAILQAHVDHALEHGLVPGGDYAVSTHSEPTPFTGTLVGTNELGVLMHAWGSKLLSFHPWASIRAMIRQS